MKKMLPQTLNQKNVENTKPAFRFDPSMDVSQWQARAREALRSLLGLDKIQKPQDDHFTVEYERDHPDFKEIRFTIQSEEGYAFPSVMLIPHGIPTPAPTMLCLQGHSTGMHISLGRAVYEPDEEDIRNGDRDFALRAVKEGCIAVAIEQRNFGECGNQPNGNPNCHVSTMSALLVGRTTIGERVHDVSCVIDALLLHFDVVDKDKIMLMGNSGGGTTTLYAAALDPRISLAMPSCSVCTYKSSIAAMRHCVCNFVPNIALYFDMGEIGGLVAPRPLIVVNGSKDRIFPADGVKEAFDTIQTIYRAAGAEQKCTLVTGEGGHRFYADAAWPHVHRLSGI